MPISVATTPLPPKLEKQATRPKAAQAIVDRLEGLASKG
jgi:hypothetical protein